MSTLILIAIVLILYIGMQLLTMLVKEAYQIWIRFGIAILCLSFLWVNYLKNNHPNIWVLLAFSGFILGSFGCYFYKQRKNN